LAESEAIVVDVELGLLVIPVDGSVPLAASTPSVAVSCEPVSLGQPGASAMVVMNSSSWVEGFQTVIGAMKV